MLKKLLNRFKKKEKWIEIQVPSFLKYSKEELLGEKKDEEEKTREEE